jgi:hypothetical protein
VEAVVPVVLWSAMTAETTTLAAKPEAIVKETMWLELWGVG